MPIDYGEGERGEMIKTLAEPRVEAVKMQEVRSNFFSSMMAASTSSSTAPARGWMKEKKEEWLQGEHQLGLSRKKSH